jgi:hypothetical protein
MAVAFDLSRLKNTLLLQRKPLVVGASLLLSSVAILAFGAYPLWGNIDTVNTNLKQEQQALAKIRQRASLVSNLSDEDLEKFNIAADSLPTQKEPLGTVRHLQFVAAEAGVGLKKYDVNPGLISTDSAEEVTTSRRARARKSTSSTQFLDLETEFAGTFEELRRLIILLENARPILEIQTLTLDPEKRIVGAAAANLEYVAKIRLRSYYAVFDPKVLVGAGVAPLSKEQEKTLTTLSKMRSWGVGTSQEGGTSTVPSGGFVNSDIFGLQNGASTSAKPILTPNAPSGGDSSDTPENRFREQAEEVSDETVEEIQQSQ